MITKTRVHNITITCDHMFNLLEILNKQAILAEKLTSTITNLFVELETRMLIPQFMIPDFDFISTTIQYYKSDMYPNLTIRRDSNLDYYETKELINKVSSDNINIVCSIEKRYKRLPFNVVKTILRTISRYNDEIITIICMNNLVEKDDRIYSLEIEYNKDTVDICYNTLIKYCSKYWKSKKPLDVYSSELLSKITNESYYISAKYDGIHITIFIQDNNYIAINDSGKIIIKQGIITNAFNNSEHIIEAEYIDNKVYIIDVLKYNNKDVRTHKYLSRLSNFKDNKFNFLEKSISLINNYESFKLSYDLISNISVKKDGFILTNSKNYYNAVYKSKQIPTVDLQYLNGNFYLANELFSTRTNYEQEYFEGMIYEFDLNMNFVRNRPDKINANYRMPVEIDPISKIYNGIGVTCLRYHHNKVKLHMLNLTNNYDKILLDCGSGLGSDYDKWVKLQYEKVYAIEPNNNFRIFCNKSLVVNVRDNVQNIYNRLNYNICSFFFVPWNNEFIEVMIKAKVVFLIIMDKAINYNCNSYNVKVLNKIYLEIPETVTALNIIEEIPDKEYIINTMKNNGFKVNELDIPMIWGSKEEIILSKMYSYLVFTLK